jgi:nucleobase:cation symporter-1, NCS1 family
MSREATKFRMEKTHHSLISDGVDEKEQLLEKHKPFWVFFVGNMGIPCWLMGVLVAGMGINFADAMFVILLGNCVGCLLPAAVSVLGPKTRLSSMESSRFALGVTGKRISALLQWVACVGWDCINNLMAAAALSLFFASMGTPLPLWIILGGMIGVQMLIGIYGHHLVQDTSKYTGIFLGIAFVAIGLIAMHKIPLTQISDKPSQLKDLVSAFILLVAFNVSGWTTWTADYTRYLPKATPSKNIFLIIFMSTVLSAVILMVFGYVTSPAVSEQTPDGVMQALRQLSGHFAPLVLILIGLSSTPVNAMNDTSASYSLISAGIKVSRPTAAIVGATIGYIVCLVASSAFMDFFENLLSLFTHWMAPWAAIVLVHWFTIGRKEQKTPSGISLGGWIFIITSTLSIILFSANSLYTGVLSSHFDGQDVGPYIGFTVAALVYYAALKARTANN